MRSELFPCHRKTQSRKYNQKILKKDVGTPCFWKLIQLAFLAKVPVVVCAFVLVLLYIYII